LKVRGRNLAIATALVASITKRVDVCSSGEPANGRSTWPSISAEGRFVGFDSTATDLVRGDTNGERDVFVRGPLR
jgi:hypothetical protein